MSYRKFSLINSDGNEWFFTDKQVKSFLSSPQGLGFENSLETVRYGNRQIVTNQEYSFPAVGGELLFYDVSNASRYQLYNDFCGFASKVPLKLKYTLPFQTPVNYYLDCFVTSLEKTETSTEGMLQCSITLQGTSFWYGDEQTVTGTGTTYTITNNSDFPIGFEILVEGSLTDPYFTLSQDESLYGEGKFDGTFDSISVNSEDGKQNVELIQDSAILPNPLAYQDLSISNGSIYVTFVKLAKGESTLTLGVSSGSISNVTIKYCEEYRSV